MTRTPTCPGDELTGQPGPGDEARAAGYSGRPTFATGAAQAPSLEQAHAIMAAGQLPQQPQPPAQPAEALALRPGSPPVAGAGDAAPDQAVEAEAATWREAWQAGEAP